MWGALRLPVLLTEAASERLAKLPEDEARCLLLLKEVRGMYMGGACCTFCPIQRACTCTGQLRGVVGSCTVALSRSDLSRLLHESCCTAELVWSCFSAVTAARFWLQDRLNFHRHVSSLKKLVAAWAEQADEDLTEQLVVWCEKQVCERACVHAAACASLLHTSSCWHWLQSLRIEAHGGRLDRTQLRASNDAPDAVSTSYPPFPFCRALPSTLDLAVLCLFHFHLCALGVTGRSAVGRH